MWKLFLALDSERYPVRNFADVFGRLFGPAMRHFVNVAQTVQLVVVLGFIVLLNGVSDVPAFLHCLFLQDQPLC